MVTKAPPPSVQSLKAALDDCLRADRFRFSRKLDRLKGALDPTTSPATGSGKKKKNNKSRAPADPVAELTRLAAEIADSVQTLTQRRARKVQVQFPEELPVCEHREKIARLIEQHQVVVVCGETGSGKSTQLPKICLEMGRGVDGMIAHTQPRRLAARTLATRIAQELNTRLGELVGFKVRFTDETGDDTAIKLLTDGMLLAEVSGDRFLDQYDTIIIDEAHERSLNIDFLLGVIKRILPRRPDLKVIITSATIDPDRFSTFFDGAPVVEVSGRLYPVEVRYRAPNAEDLPKSISNCLDEVFADGPGDVLVFLPGEREIRETRDHLNRKIGDTGRQAVEVLPLFSRLSRADQDRVFKTGAKRRVVLSTNVAETSVTVPGIRYVIDTGVARINRYSPGRKITRLPIERISQASADQRKGRCGRVASGVCFRLYDEDDFDTRDEFTTPEILRSSLADVILRMLDMRLGDVEDFAFIEPPSGKQIRDGYRLLEELGALNDENRLSAIGKQLARLPLDPRIGRMVVAGKDAGCLDDMLTITAALSIADPRVTPFDAVEKARQQHRLLDHERSDFMTLLNIWDRWHESMQGTSRRAGRRFCETHFLSIVRMYEWQDLRRQIAQAARDLDKAPGGKKRPKPSAETTPNAREMSDEEREKHEQNVRRQSEDRIHKALLTGLLGSIANHHEGREYMGTRNTKLSIHPSSVLRKKTPRWVVAAELVETTALFARTLAPIQPQWVEQIAGNLVKRSYSEPRWHKKPGRVMAQERVTLLGLSLIANRSVDFGAVRPADAREVFILEALVPGELGRPLPFLQRNMALLDDVEALEDRFRRRDIRVDDRALFEFYDERLPEHVYSAAALDQWWRQISESDPGLLDFDRALVQLDEAADSHETDFPATLVVDGLVLTLEYLFKPGAAEDGVTAVIPIDQLNRLEESGFERLVPGLLRDRLISLLKSLPKQTRTRLVPVPDVVDGILSDLDAQVPLRLELSRLIKRARGVEIKSADWPMDDVADHLKMRFRLVNPKGKTVASGRNLALLKAEHGKAAAKSFSARAQFGIEKDDVTKWDFGELPERISGGDDAGGLTGFPALVDTGDACAVRVVDSPEKARRLSRAGIKRLLMLELPGLRKMLEKKLPDINQLCLLYSPLGDTAGLKADIAAALLSAIVDDVAHTTRTREDFEALKAVLKKELPRKSMDICGHLLRSLEAWQRVSLSLAQNNTKLPAQIVSDIRAQMASLVYTDFVQATPEKWLREMPRFMQAIEERLNTALVEPGKDLGRLKTIQPLLDRFANTADPELTGELKWMLQELRVSVFAQKLGTSIPISAKRIEKYWAKLDE